VNSQHTDLHYELSWIFTNLASIDGEFVMKYLNRKELFDYINNFLKSTNTNILDNILFLVGNIVGDE